MIEHIFTATVFILALLLIRALFHNRISKLLCYSIWLFAAFKLLIPLPWLSNSFNIMNTIVPYMQSYSIITDTPNLVSNTEELLTAHDELEHSYTYEVTKPLKTVDFARNAMVLPSSKDTENDIPITAYGTKDSIIDTQDRQSSDNSTISSQKTRQPADSIISFCKYTAQAVNNNRNLLILLWITGSILLGGIIGISNLLFAIKLTKTRQPADTKNFDMPLCDSVKKTTLYKCPVYTTDEITVPFLWGLFHPAIYITEAFMAASTEKLSHVITHEWVHYLHKDHIWALLRAFILIIYWWHPLVWIAVRLSITDSELACDEGVIHLLGTESLKSYGETLIEMGTGKQNLSPLFIHATGLAGGKQELKKRILAITIYRKQSLVTALLFCILLLGITGCTFGTTTENTSAASDEVKTDKTNEAQSDIQQTENPNNYGSLTISNLVIINGEKNWDDFKKASNSKKGTETEPLIIIIETNIDGERFAEKLTFDGQLYHYNGRKWKYLLDVEGLTGNPKKMCRQAALANEIYTYKELEWSVLSSSSNDWIDHDLLFYADAHTEKEDYTLTKTTPSPTGDKINIAFSPMLFDTDTTGMRYFVPEGALPEQKLFPAISRLAPLHEAEKGWFEGRHHLGCYVICNGITWELISGNCLYTCIEDENGEEKFILETPETNKDCADICEYVLAILRDSFDYEPADVTKWTDIKAATLDYNDKNTGVSGSQTITDPDTLQTLEKWFSEAEPMLAGSGCPFNVAKLTFTFDNGETASMMIAQDSCPIFQVNGVFYDYRPSELQGIISDDSTFTSDSLKEIFDGIPWEH
ncbi:MAG: M56 family metallopeptidase [Lachnospiraceae bacterium]|nr:M56 family metallopeptidase [Lachnospiraceae bacterium]